jgi:hypothetical protein
MGRAYFFFLFADCKHDFFSIFSIYKFILQFVWFRYGFAKGNYTLKVDYRFSVARFDGTKRIILSTTSLLGGKNPFLGIAYIVVGCLFLVTGIVFIFVHIKYGKSNQEMISVTPQTPY